MHWMRWAAVAVVAVAVGHGLYLVLFGFSACSVVANDPGEPRNEAVCHPFVSFPGLAIVGLLALAGLAMAFDRLVAAWPLAAIATATTFVFGFSLGMLLYHCGATLASVALWQATRRSVCSS